MAPNKRKILESARKYVQKGAKDKALKEYDKLLKLDPRDAKLRLEIGDAHRRWGQVDEAIAAYNKVAEQYTDEGFDARAVAVFKQIQGLDPECWTSYVPLADLYQRMGLNSEAVQALQTAADGLHKAGEKRDALELLRKMATLDPGNTTSRIKVADLLKQEGMDDEALVEYDAASVELERQGESEAATKVYERVLEIAPDRIATLSALGRNLVACGHAPRAEPFVKRALEIEPEETGHYELMADVYRAQGRDADLAENYRTLADIFRERGDDDSAREIIQRFVPPEDLGPAAGSDIDEFGAAGDLLEEELLDEEELLEDDDLLEEVAPTPSVAPAAQAAPEPSLDAPDLDAVGGGVLELGMDAGVEVPEEAPSQVPLPEKPAAAAKPVPGADPDQLLAEASVYLRYGKRAQAIRNLEGVLAAQPDHRAALEKLGEAHADGGDSEEAVAVWVHAAELAQAEGDAVAVGVLRDRVSSLMPDAIDRMPGGGEDISDDDIPAEEIEELLAASQPSADEAVGEDAAAEDELIAFDDDEDIEIDASDLEDEDDVEIVFDSDDDDEDLLVVDDLDDAALDTPLDLDEGLGDPTGEHLVLDEDEPLSLQAAAAESSQTATGASASLSVSAQVNDDLEEAEFYWQQGLKDEAEAIYQRVLETAPNHPMAQVRLGELAAARGGDPSDTATLASNQAEPTLDERPALEIDDEVDAGMAADAADEPDSDAAPLDAELEIDAAPEALDLDDEPSVGDSDDAIEPLALDNEPVASVAADEPDSAVERPAFEPDEAPVAAASDEELFGDEEPVAALGDDGVSDAAAAELTLDAGDTPAIGADADPAGASFDLAAELSDFFDDGDSGPSGTASSSALGNSAEQDVFAAVFSEFKKGVSEQLGDGDHEAHYDLGIAYREMGLLEDAVGEFHTAATSDDRRLECLHLLGLCTLDLGRGEEAVGHLQGAIDISDPTADHVTPLRFDLGRAFESLGRIDEARAAWEAVVAVDPSFCEVEERLATLGDEKPEAPADDGMESFEEFFQDDDDESVEDDSDDSDGATGEVAADPQHESFDDLIAEANAEPEPEAAAEPMSEAPVEAVPADSAPAIEPEPEPEATTNKRRKKKISFV